MSLHPNTSPRVLVLKGGNPSPHFQMRSAPGSRDLKQAWLGVTRTNWKPARNTLPTAGGQGIGDQGCLPWGCRCARALCADALGQVRAPRGRSGSSSGPRCRGPFAAGQQLAVPPACFSSPCPSATVGPRFRIGPA